MRKSSILDVLGVLDPPCICLFLHLGLLEYKQHNTLVTILVTLALLIFIFEFSQDDTMASPLTASSASVIPSIALLSPPCSADTSFLGKKIERNSLAQNQQ